MPENPAQREKIVILGGGIGALTAAFALTSRPRWQENYEITVYQLGWRLGGKCASGRNPEPNKGQRIEEHGVHVWFGFYDNALGMIRKCYEEYGTLQAQGLVHPNGLASFDDAFKKHNLFTVMEDQGDEGWLPWQFDFPPNARGPDQETWDYMQMLLAWLCRNFRRLLAQLPEERSTGDSFRVWWELITARETGRHQIIERITAFKALFVQEDSGPVSAGRLPSPAEELIADLCDFHEQGQDAILLFLKLIRGFLADQEQLIKNAGDICRQLWILLNLGAAIALGMIRDHVVDEGFEVIDQFDLTKWLQRQGVNYEDIWWSAPVRAIYDAVFAFEEGDPAKPNLAAGTGLRGILRLFFDYKEAFAWKMQAGMGDTVFTPLYKVLKYRGVKFRFFHRVEKLHLSQDKQFIDSIDMTRQAIVTGGEDKYEPLCKVKDLWCWPSVPPYAQLEEGQQLKDRSIDLESAWADWQGQRFTLKQGPDFHRIILGIPLGYLPYICKELLDANQRWRAMVNQVKTIPTQAFQLWLRNTTEDMGWHGGYRAIVAAYVEPIDTWADMSHLIPREDWPNNLVQNISYFCGPLREEPMPEPFKPDNYLEDQKQRAKDQAHDFLRRYVRPLWPSATNSPHNSDGLNWDLLVDLDGNQGEQRFNTQYWRANADPSERYVLSVAGSTQYRLRADRSGFKNLLLAGDWTKTGMNCGCVEAAVMSGLRAAKFICGYPEKIFGEENLDIGVSGS